MTSTALQPIGRSPRAGRRLLALAAVLLLLPVSLGQAHNTARLVFDADADPVRGSMLEPFEPLPAPPELAPGLIALGAQLFSDPRLSALGGQSCASCHRLEHLGTDGLQRSRLADGGDGLRNTPQIFNLAYAYWFNWDGRYRSLRELISDAVEAPDKLASDWARVVLMVSGAGDYAPRLRALGRDGADRELLVAALEAYVLSLRTPDSPFDQYLAGDDQALSKAARRGLATFLANGCASCHNGVNLGGNMMQRSHMLEGYFEEHEEVNAEDLGRFDISGDDGDRYLFRVPMLRGVALTPPYLHDGSLQTLELAIEEMGEHQIGIDFSEAEINDIKAFLESLSPGAVPP